MGRLVNNFILGCAIQLMASPAIADDSDQLPSAAVTAGIISLEKAISVLPIIDGSRVIEVELETKHGVLIYEIERLEDQGIVREYKIDAQSGRLLSVEID